MLNIDLTASKIVWVLAALLICYTVYWIIRSLKDPYYPSTIRNILAMLRTAAILIFIIIFLDIKITHIIDRQVEPEIAFCWDLSQSMSSPGNDDFSVTDLLRSSSFRAMDRQTRVSHVADMLDPKIYTEQQLRTIPINEAISDNSKLLRWAEKQARFQELVLISDGRSYMGESLESIRLSKDLTVHTIGVGRVAETELPSLRSIRFPDHVLQGDSIALSWSLENPSDDNMRTELILMKDEEEVYRQEIEIPAQRMKAFDHTFSPSNKGVSNWTWLIGENGEKTEIGSENLYVHPSAIRIVIHADPPDQDIAMISTVLSRLEHIDIYKDTEWKISFPNEKPDLLIQTWHPDTQVKIFQDIPSILFYRDSKDNYITSGELLVVGLQPYLYIDTNPITNSRYWKALPPIQIANYQGDGITIMETNQGRPVVLENKKEQNLIINASGLWRWNLAGFEKDWDGIYIHLIEGMVNEQIRRAGKSYLALDEEIYSSFAYQPINLRVEQYNRELLDLDETTLRVTLMDSSFEEIHHKELGARSDNITSFILKEAGEYYAKAELFTHGVLLESDTAKILVEENNMEFSQKGSDLGLLKQLAERHGGSYCHINDLDSLQYKISTDKHWEQVNRVFIARRSYLLFILMFLLLCADWVIRKRNGGM
ncbi:MAG: VWA domain-containing protein [Candidatus Marinimicrobia bacterium]|nr:VWA domain-containing protein [Candidatus Neomarinimicrobiota bacterium]